MSPHRFETGKAGQFRLLIAQSWDYLREYSIKELELAARLRKLYYEAMHIW